jgi:glucose-6-phosphate isomerase
MDRTANFSAAGAPRGSAAAVFGDGHHGQHAFFQMLHQGTG